MKIGLLGGSFNPAHEGHVHLSRWAYDLLEFDQVWWLVSPQNPLKSSQDMASFSERYQSALDVTDHIPWLIVSDYEQQKQNAYTAITLKSITQDFPEYDFVWLMGQDNWETIHQWQEWQEIFQTMPIAVAPRDFGDDDQDGRYTCPAFATFKEDQEKCEAAFMDQELPAWTFLTMPKHPLSSTQIRREKIAKENKTG